MAFPKEPFTAKSSSMKLNKLTTVIYLLVILLSAGSCSYRFNPGSTGAARSLHIENFENLSAQGPANLSQIFSEKLRAYYQQNSDLAIVRADGDWQIDGVIARYEVIPVAPQGNETSATNNLEISIEVNFVNTLYSEETKSTEQANFTQMFSGYLPFPGNQNLSQVETALIDEILDQIVFDIFTRTTSNW